MAKEIIAALVDYTENGNKFTEQFSSYVLKPYQKVLIDDIVQIFFEHTEICLELLEHLKLMYGGSRAETLKKITYFNIYNRLLECYLVLRQRSHQKPQSKPNTGTAPI